MFCVGLGECVAGVVWKDIEVPPYRG
jgi:hypothetical protein